jgi:hypothetical protein
MTHDPYTPPKARLTDASHALAPPSDRSGLVQSVLPFGCGAFVVFTAQTFLLRFTARAMLHEPQASASLLRGLLVALAFSLFAAVSFLIIARKLNRARSRLGLVLLGSASALLTFLALLALQFLRLPAPPIFVEVAAIISLISVPSMLLPVAVLGYARSSI